jgi:CRP/FNR family transcriptional regulator
MSIRETLSKYIPNLEVALLDAMEDSCQTMKVPGGKVIMEEGAYVNGLPIVLDGRVKVFTSGEEKDLLLYYIKTGETCIMSFSACISESRSKVTAVTEIDTEILMIGVDRLENWLRAFTSLNRYLYDLHNRRYLDLLTTIDQLIFWKLDERVMRYLRERVVEGQPAVVSCTHQEIANDLGSSREVITRVLKKLVVAGKIELGRHQVILL